MKTTVIFHSADFDGLFCREIARKFLPDAELIGWDFKDEPLAIPPEGQIYILDLPVDRVFGFDFNKEAAAKFTRDELESLLKQVIWIDHHASSIASHPTSIPGYRIDGVAACRLAWQWFDDKGSCQDPAMLPSKQEYIDRKVSEPLAVRLAGEYDIWDHRGDGDLEFQFGLRSRELTPEDWASLLYDSPNGNAFTKQLIADGSLLQRYQQSQDKKAMSRSFLVDFEGLKFLAHNSGGNSLVFDSKDVPETGHDALMSFAFNGKAWTVSMYHAKHRKDIDLSQIAVKQGGGGHRGACGFTTLSITPLLKQL